MKSSRPAIRTRAAAVGALAALAVGSLAACSSSSSDGSSPDDGHETSAAAASGTDQESTPDASPVKVSDNLGNGRAVPVDTLVKVNADGGTLDSVSVKSSDGKVDGDLGDGAWTATGRLQPGAKYQLIAQVTDEAGKKDTVKKSFQTQQLTLDQQTYPSVAPLDGETVGVGMPVVVSFDVPVTDHAAFEKQMKVTSTPQQAGSWRWISDTEAHWRPKSYWKAGTDVSVDLDLDSIPAGDGIYGQESRTIDFHVGDAVVSKVNAQTHQMKTFVNGKLQRTTPITTGSAGHTTRSGVKVIMEKYRTKRMSSETVGIDPNSADGYDIDDVEYAMRVTSSGEFLHAAPWSVGSQGVANVSHGCTGMSTDSAAWLYGISKRGDVVEYTGTNRPMTPDNGWGDWNLSYAQYEKGSAL